MIIKKIISGIHTDDNTAPKSTDETQDVTRMSMSDFVQHISQKPTETYIQLFTALKNHGPNFSFQPYMDELKLAIDGITKMTNRFEATKELGNKLIQDANKLIKTKAPFHDTYKFLMKVIWIHTQTQHAENAYLDSKNKAHATNLTHADINPLDKGRNLEISSFLRVSPISLELTENPYYHPNARIDLDKYPHSQPKDVSEIEEFRPCPFMLIITSSDLSEKDLFNCGGAMLQGFARNRMAFDKETKAEFTTENFKNHDRLHAYTIWRRQQASVEVKMDARPEGEYTLKIKTYKKFEKFSKAAEKYIEKIADKNLRLAAELLAFNIGHEECGPNVWTKKAVLESLEIDSHMMKMIKDRAHPSNIFAYSPKYKTQEVYDQIENARQWLLEFVESYRD